MVEILALVLHHEEQAVLVAVELALEDGVPCQDPHPQPAPQADRWQACRPRRHNRSAGLALANEPRADVERYESCAGPGGAPCVMIPPVGALVVMLRGLKKRGMAQAVE